MTFKCPEQHRFRFPGGWPGDATNGAFIIDNLRIIASDGEAWEHVSVSTSSRCPTWDEMCFVKGLFWSEEDCVVQFHPPKSEYVNVHPYCLHLWRKVGSEFETPPSLMVGPK